MTASTPQVAERTGAGAPQQDGEGRPLRIGVFTYGLPAPGRKRGGTDRVAHDLAQGLARRGHSVRVLSHDDAPPEAAYTVRHLPLRGFAGTWLGQRLTHGYLGNVAVLFADWGEVDTVIAMGDTLLLPLLGKPVVRVMHGSALGEARSATTLPRKVMQLGVYAQELITAALQPGCVGVSENTRRYNPFVRRVIPNGIDLQMFHPPIASRSQDPSVLFVGTLDGRKRGRLLLDWFESRIRSRVPTARLMMVCADGPPQPGVSYHAGLGQAELAELYRQAWVYASPSSYEGFGLPYLEAMASGTPVVATPNPGSREVLDGGRFGRLVDDGSFPEAVIDLLEHEKKRATLAQVGLDRAREFDKELMIDRYEKLLLELCARSGRAH